MKTSLLTILAVTVAVILCLIDIPRVRAESGSEEFTLEEITVTAQKRSENQQKVDIPMQVFTAEDIKETGKTDIDAILSDVSSAIIARSSDGMRVSIRGISDDNSTFFGQSQSAPTVAVNMDGARSNRKDKASDLFDIERVEVLMGPQSTLYSSNSPGGVVNIVTGQPKLEKYQVSGVFEYGNYNLRHIEAVLNAPVGKMLAMRAAYYYSKRDGYLSNGGDDADTQSGRFRALFQPVENFSITATAQETRKGGNGLSTGVVAFLDEDDTANPWTADTAAAGGTNLGKKTVTKDYTATINWSTKYFDITALPQYSKGTTHNRTESATFGIQFQDRSYMEKGYEIRLASSADFSIKWILGYNFYKQTDFNYRGTEGSETFSNRRFFEDSKSIFANVTYPVMDTFRLVAGYRRNTDVMDTINIERKLGPPIAGLPREMQDFNETRHTAYKSPDYKFGFEYDLGTQSMMFGNYATSYRISGWGAGGTTQPKPEILKAYTLGVKNRFFNNKLQLNFSTFYYDYKNKPASLPSTVWFDTNPADGKKTKAETISDPNGSQYGTGINKGFDLQTNWMITQSDLLNFSWSYINSEWSDLVFDYLYNTTDALNGTVVVHNVPVPDVSYNGKPMANSPPNTFSLSYTHSFIFSNGSGIKATFDGRYQTHYRLSWRDSEYPWNFQENYRTINLSAVYTSAGGHVSLSGYIKNLDNYAVKRMYMSGVTNPTTGLPNIGTMQIAAPRTYGAVLSVQY